MNKTFTTGLIVGVCAIIAIGSAYFTIKTIATVSNDHAVLGQVVQLINNSQKQSAPAPVPSAK